MLILAINKLILCILWASTLIPWHLFKTCQLQSPFHVALAAVGLDYKPPDSKTMTLPFFICYIFRELTVAFRAPQLTAGAATEIIFHSSRQRTVGHAVHHIFQEDEMRLT